MCMAINVLSLCARFDGAVQIDRPSEENEIVMGWDPYSEGGFQSQIPGGVSQAPAGKKKPGILRPRGLSVDTYSIFAWVLSISSPSREVIDSHVDIVIRSGRKDTLLLPLAGFFIQVVQVGLGGLPA